MCRWTQLSDDDFDWTRNQGSTASYGTGPMFDHTLGSAAGNSVSNTQRAKKVVSGSPGLVDLAVGLVNSVINLPDGQVNFLGGNSNYRRTVINPAHQIFGG